MPADAVAAYHDLLAADATLAADSRAALDRGQEARGLVYGKRPVCSVLRPRFQSPAQYRFLHDRVNVLLPALRTAHDRALSDPGFRRQFRLRDWEDELLGVDPGYPDPAPTSRFDAFFASESHLRFTEFNTETPAGAGYSDSLGRLFYGLPAFQEFERRYQVWPVLARPGVLHALMDSFKRWRGNSSDPPRVAILDWREVPTFAEFVLFYDYFKAMGVKARIVDPRDVEYHGGKLRAGDFHITLIYKLVFTDELIARGGLEHPIVRAVRDGAACMVNSFRSRVLGKKASVAVLSDERNAEMFTPEERRAIAEHVPWTRLVEDRRTVVDGAEIDLVPFVFRNKDQLVLRPNDGHGAEGIVSGWTVDGATWEAAVQKALTEPYVVQEKVGLPAEPFPTVDGGRLQVSDWLVDTSPFVAFGEFMHGCLTRISAAAPVNVAGGGSIVPTFVVEPR
ncbi:MAG: hypothetical protein JWO38_2995 [Gemmataceae bacterium]|nr:hypothetical protein [Gemmataceae bacterium]